MLSVIMGLFDIGGEGKGGGSIGEEMDQQELNLVLGVKGGGGMGIFCGERNGATVWTLFIILF